MKKIVCFEFDGVLHVTKPGIDQGMIDVLPGKMPSGAKSIILGLQKDGYHIVVRSDRCYHSCGKVAINKYLYENGVEDVELTAFLPEKRIAYVAANTVRFESYMPCMIYDEIVSLDHEEDKE